MAITVNQNYTRVSMGNKWRIQGLLSLDNSYPVGGYPLNPASFGLDRIESVVVPPERGYVLDFESGKLAVFITGVSATALNPLPIITSTYTNRLYYTGAVGVFVSGETITGTVSGNTATITTPTVNREPGIAMDVSAPTGLFALGETITGGTSGATATLATTLLDVNPIIALGTSSIQTAYDFATNISYQIISHAAILGVNQVRLEPGPIVGGVASFNDAEVISTTGSTNIAWGFWSYDASLATALAEVPGGTDLTLLHNVEFEVTGL